MSAPRLHLRQSSLASFGTLLTLAVALAAGCAVVDDVVQGTADVAKDGGLLTDDQAGSVKKTSAAFRKSAEDFTDSEEYYIGRSVAANILTHGKLVEDEELTRYVNRVGLAVAFASDRPNTYSGYHFAILDTDEINAFAAPSGFIFISRGTLALCEDEDMLACVLAHEVGHVVGKHGLKAIKKDRILAAFKTLVVEAGHAYTDAEVEELEGIFDGSVGDIMGGLTNGYDRGLEEDADELGAIYAARAGYDPRGLVRFLAAMQKQASVAQGGFFKTHPPAGDRVPLVEETIEDKELGGATTLEARTARFRAAARRG